MNNLTKEDKWLLVSCLQKSIRKGFDELAISYADRLYEIERSYLVYRLSIIAVEDVGLGNLSLMNDFLATQIKKANIEERGGKEYILKLTGELARSVKDRSACDLTSLCFYDPSTNGLGEDRNTEKMKEIYLDNSQPVGRRINAAWEILGAKKQKNLNIKNQEDDLERFLDLNRELIYHLPHSTAVLDSMRNGYIIHRESHFIALGLLYSLLEAERDQKIGSFVTGSFVERQFAAHILENTWLIDGIDWHTKEGKSAIYDFCKSNPPVVRFLKSQHIGYESIPHIIGKLLFRKCGHQVNQRLFYPSAVKILKSTEKLELKESLHNSGIDLVKLNQMFEQDFPLLREKIQQIFVTPDPKHFPF